MLLYSCIGSRDERVEHADRILVLTVAFLIAVKMSLVVKPPSAFIFSRVDPNIS